ncbi:CDF family Co(II)/Ni(II) efflux transporter DmeF [Sphingobium cloacae]|uniref:Cation efflux system protein n=1 Tax=Sphingobium cloacae TaxID=120107 RepID=A0A1E1F1P5_9SPHN|nr:CDF family Co(II)/Ni(II) efflux transporter DmeF [Sphingobium cloacae]BAV64443.1 cation efflux system protein [Sphingobium cloacae]
MQTEASLSNGFQIAGQTSPQPLPAKPVRPLPVYDFLGHKHDDHARRTRWVLALCAGMMILEITGGLLFGSMALLTDGLHMGTHAGVMLIAAGAYRFARRRVGDPTFAFGTGKVGDLAAFASAVVLGATAVMIVIESIERILNPVAISFREAIPIAVLGLIVNLISIWLLHDHHAHEHEHPHGHEHEHEHHAAHGDHGAHRGHHHDHNLRAAYIHVLADAAVGLLAIIGLSLGWALGWLWLDPAMALLGACLILSWAFSLVRATGNVLLDRVPDPELAATIRCRLEQEGVEVEDLHFWRLGPGHHGLVAALSASSPQSPATYRDQLSGIPTLSHVVIQVERKGDEDSFL